MSPKRYPEATNPEDDPFPFTEEELFAAFHLVSGIEEARANAKMVIEQLSIEPNWATSPETLALLALGSISAAKKVAAIRQQGELDRDSWMLIEMHRAGLPAGSAPPAWLEAQWQAANEASERAWQETLSEVRKGLTKAEKDRERPA